MEIDPYLKGTRTKKTYEHHDVHFGSNFWIIKHDEDHPTGCLLILIMDVSKLHSLMH
jgi:hypothetical protein